MIKRFLSKIPSIAVSAYVDSTALVLGDVKVGKDSSIWPMSVVRGDIHKIEIGDRSNIQDGTIIHVTHSGNYNPEGFPTIIGDEVIVGHRVVLHGCTIHNNSLIGMGAIVMDGAIIQSDVIVGAGSLVPPGKELTAGHLWIGTPIQKIRPITEKEHAFLRYSANYYVALKDEYLDL